MWDRYVTGALRSEGRVSDLFHIRSYADSSLGPLTRRPDTWNRPFLIQPSDLPSTQLSSAATDTNLLRPRWNDGNWPEATSWYTVVLPTPSISAASSILSAIRFGAGALVERGGVSKTVRWAGAVRSAWAAPSNASTRMSRRSVAVRVVIANRCIRRRRRAGIHGPREWWR